MSQFKLRKIHLKNWMTVREQEIEFPSQGLVFVSGTDESSQFESIGSGKTSLGEALCITVCGIRGRYSSIGHYSTHEKGNTLVRVEGTLGHKSLSIEMGYKFKELSKTGEGLRFSLDDKTIARSHVGLTRSELSQTLGISEDVAMWSVYVDGDKLDFSSLSQTQAVELMMSALGQPSWSAYHDKAKKTLNELKSDVAAKSSSKETLQELITTTQTAIVVASDNLEKEKIKFDTQKQALADQLKTSQTQLNLVKGEIAQRDAKRKEIKAQIKKIEEELAEQHKALEVEEMRLKNEKATISLEKKPLSLLESKLNSEHYKSDLDLKSLRLKPKECPTCKKPWDRGPSDSDIEKATEKVTQVLEKLKGVRDQIEEITAREEAKQDEIDEHQKKQRQLNVKDKVRSFSNDLDAIDKLDQKAANDCTTLREY
jgi:DNA repair exonuclease SbcCD ATPase subunit